MPRDARPAGPLRDLVWPAAELKVRVPHGTPFSAPAALQLTNTLLTPRRVLAFEIHSQEGRIDYRVILPWSMGPAARGAILGMAPGATISMAQPSARTSRPALFAFGNRAGVPWAPLPVLASGRTPDPLNPLLQALAGLARGEEAVFQVLVRPSRRDWPAAILQETTTRQIPWGAMLNWRRWPEAAMDYAFSPPQPRFGGDLQRLIEDKHGERLVEAAVTLAVWSRADRAVGVARACSMALSGLASPLSTLKLLPPGTVAWQDLAAGISSYHFTTLRGQPASPGLLVLTPSELAALWHLPSEATTVETVAWAAAGSLMAQPQAVAAEAGPGVILGLASRPEGSQPVVLPEADRRAPLLIVGKTGMGKTSFMENLVDQDIAAGRGVALLDVHGDMTMRLLSRIPPQRIAQVVIIDPSHAQSCVALNPLALADRLDRNILVGELIGVFRQYFGDLWSVGRMEDTLRAVLWALTSRPGLSLGDMGRLFHDPVFRHQLATAITNPVVKEYWLQEFAQLSPAQQLERSSVLLNKVRAFLTNDNLRRMLTAPSCLDLRRHMDSGGILFVRPVGLAEAESNLLTGLVAALLFAAARSRADIPVERRRVCYLYLDEAQTLVSSSLPSILSQGRKFGLPCGGLALQHMEALDPAVRGALLGNAGTFVAFRCGPADARLLQPALSPLTAVDLENVDRFRAVCKMQRGGVTLPAFGLEPPDPLRLGSLERATAALESSRERHGIPEQAQPMEQQDDGNGRDATAEDTWDTA